jgi:hypothetical protein
MARWRDAQKPAWVVITNAISYLARHVYVTAGDRRAIDEVSEEVIDQVVACAQRAHGFWSPLARLTQYSVLIITIRRLVRRGEPVTREVILQLSSREPRGMTMDSEHAEWRK